MTEGIRYVATVNTPGYLPWDDDPPVFDSPSEAWTYLADERKRAEDELDPPGESYSETALHLEHLGEHAGTDTPVAWREGTGLDITGLGTVYGPTPGYDGDHDLGVAYSVSYADEGDGE